MLQNKNYSKKKYQVLGPTQLDKDFVEKSDNNSTFDPTKEYYGKNIYRPLGSKGRKGPSFRMAKDKHAFPTEKQNINVVPVNAEGEISIDLPEFEIFDKKGTLATDYPYYNNLSKEEKKYFNDQSPIGRQIRMKARDGKGVDSTSAGKMVNAMVGPEGLNTNARIMSTPQALTIEGIEYARGNKASFSNAMPNVYGKSKQRTPDMYLPENTHPIIKGGVNLIADPTNLLLLGPALKGARILKNVGKGMSFEEAALQSQKTKKVFDKATYNAAANEYNTSMAAQGYKSSLPLSGGSSGSFEKSLHKHIPKYIFDKNYRTQYTKAGNTFSQRHVASDGFQKIVTDDDTARNLIKIIASSNKKNPITEDVSKDNSSINTFPTDTLKKVTPNVITPIKNKSISLPINTTDTLSRTSNTIPNNVDTVSYNTNKQDTINIAPKQNKYYSTTVTNSKEMPEKEEKRISDEMYKQMIENRKKKQFGGDIKYKSYSKFNK